MAEEYNGKVAFVGVSNNDTIEDGERYRHDFSVPYPLANAPDVWDQFGVPYQPVTIVLGPTGEQVQRIDGPVTYEGLDEILSRLTS